jgi:hypothetical protein
MERLKLSSLALALSLLAGASAFARGPHAARQTRRAEELPYPFNYFSAADVLGRVFDGYDPQTGRVAAVLNDEKKPSLVRIKEARTWNVRGQERLVVLVDMAGSDYDFQDLCGNCSMYSLLAVLKREGRSLALVARQDVPASSVAEDTDPESDEPGPDDLHAPFISTGHDNRAWLDLAGYCINEREALIGIRREHMWLPALSYSTDLTLYRIEGARLREVFGDVVVERDYPRGARKKGRPVLKTYSLVSPRPGGGEFYDLVFEKVTMRCLDRNDNADCDPPREPLKVVGRRMEVWSFDGTRFSRTRKRVPPRPASLTACAGSAFPTVARTEARTPRTSAGVTHTRRGPGAKELRPGGARNFEGGRRKRWNQSKKTKTRCDGAAQAGRRAESASSLWASRWRWRVRTC